MGNRIDEMLNRLSAAHKMIQNIVIQATAGNAANVVDSLQNLQIVFNELQAMKREMEEEKNG